MRILILSTSYPPRRGGLETVAHGLARGLLGRGHAVLVATRRLPRSLPVAERVEGVEVRRLPLYLPHLAHLFAGRPGLFAACWAAMPLGLLQLAALLRQFRPAVVNLHGVGDAAAFILALRQCWRGRLVVSLHGDDVEGQPLRSPGRRLLLRAALRGADAITACSHYLLAHAVEWEPAIAPQAVAVPNGMAPLSCAAALPQQRPYLLFIGRLVPTKGADLLLDAYGRAAATGRPLPDLLLVGDGPERLALQCQAQR